jgi:hypothetical protein
MNAPTVAVINTQTTPSSSSSSNSTLTPTQPATLPSQNPQKNPQNADPNCIGSDINGLCNVCSFRYVLDSSRRCQIVSNLCKSWNQTNGFCTDCYSGYSLALTG